MKTNVDTMPSTQNTPSLAKTTWTQHLIRILWLTFGCGFAFVLLLLILVYNGIIGYMPPIEELRNPKDKYA